MHAPRSLAAWPGTCVRAWAGIFLACTMMDSPDSFSTSYLAAASKGMGTGHGQRRGAGSTRHDSGRRCAAAMRGDNSSRANAARTTRCAVRVRVRVRVCAGNENKTGVKPGRGRNRQATRGARRGRAKARMASAICAYSCSDHPLNRMFPAPAARAARASAGTAHAAREDSVLFDCHLCGCDCVILCQILRLSWPACHRVRIL